MRSRDEVLTVESINDRLRELEAQQAASEPVASVHEIESLLNDAVGHAMDYARGDNHATNKHEAAWNEALTRIRALANPHPNSAAVRVTDAMVEAGCREHYEYTTGLLWDDANSAVRHMWRKDARIMLTAALTAASEGASDAAVTPCEWKLDDPDFSLYHTDCGNDFTLNEGGPVENRMAFCCYCGKPMKAQRTRPTTPTRGE